MYDLVDFENTYDDFDEIGNHFIYIDGYPEDEDEEGRVVAVVIKTPHNDIVVDWHDNGYRYHNTVIELIKESIKGLEGEIKMKVYLTYEVNGGELLIGGGAMGDIDCFSDLDKAVEYTVGRISDGLEYGFVADYEPEKVCEVCEEETLDRAALFNAVKEAFEENNRFELVMFGGEQENWNENYSIIIEEKEVQ